MASFNLRVPDISLLQGDFFPPAFNCPHELERIGALGDGGKWLYGLSRVAEKPDCIVYSFGERLPTIPALHVLQLDSRYLNQTQRQALTTSPRSRLKSCLARGTARYGRTTLPSTRMVHEWPEYTTTARTSSGLG